MEGAAWGVRTVVTPKVVNLKIYEREYQTHNPALIFYHANDGLVFNEIRIALPSHENKKRRRNQPMPVLK